MSTFFEIFNKVLLELNYRTVTAFEDIYKSEHIKILDAINRVNEEVLSTYEWPFLLRSEILTPKNQSGAGDLGQAGGNISTATNMVVYSTGTTTNSRLYNISTTNAQNPASGAENSEAGGNISTATDNILCSTGTTTNSALSQISTISPAPGNKSCIPLSPCVEGIVKSVYQGNTRLLYFQNLEEALQKGLPANSYTLSNTGNNGVEIFVNSVKAPFKGPNPPTRKANTPLQTADTPIQSTNTPSQTPNSETQGENTETKTLKPQSGGYITVYYYPKYTSLGADGQFKTKMDSGDDVSILPMPYAEHILLYGTCLKVKANPAYPKFGFWNTMYIQALANLRKKSTSAAEDAPFVKIV